MKAFWTKGELHFHFLFPSSTKLSQDWSVSSLGEAYTLMVIHWKINVFSRVHNVEVKTVDKHRLDEKDSRYSEIRVNSVPKRGENRWNKRWWHMHVMKARVLVHIWGWKTMYFILCINKCHNYHFFEKLISYQLLQIIVTNGPQ